MKTKDLTRREILTLGAAASATAGLVASLDPREAAAGKPAKKALPQVPRRILGKTGESVPILLMGAAMRLDPRFDPKLAEALRFGVNYIDAADCYGGGTCEPAVASFHTRAKLRKKLWITSKSDEHSPEGFLKTFERSLSRLKTDYIDMYYLHALQDPKYLDPALMKVVEKLKKEKKLRFFGFSCHHGNVAELLHEAAKRSWVDSVMFKYNFRSYGDKALNKAIDAAHKSRVGLIAMKTQSSENSFQSAWKKFEQTGKWNKHQSVLKAVWGDERISAAVSHMDDFTKLKQNIAAAVDDSKLSAVDVEALEKYARATRHMACDGCDHLCNPHVDAPVQIGTTMRAVMYHDAYDEPHRAHEAFGRLPGAAQRLRGVDFTGASAACPHGVDVVAHMRRASQIFGV